MDIRLDTPQNGFAIDWMGQRLRLPIRVSDTDGRISAQLGDALPGFRNPPHVHTREAEIFYVVSGSIELRIADRVERLGAGDLAFAPAGLPHQFSVAGSEAAKLLVFLTGETIEQAFLEGSGRPAADLKAIMSRAGVELLADFDANYRPEGFEDLTSDAAFVCRAHEGEAVWLAGDTYTVKLPGHQVGEQFALVHFAIPPGGGPVPHLHSQEFEAFVITQGEVELYADGEVLTAHPDDVALLPANITHCFKNRTNSQAQMIAVVAPAGFDRFLSTVGRPAVAGLSAPPVDAEEKQRLLQAAPDFGITLRPDISF
jgi:quercetin dioxygenase-like cupin family protein